jgi:hypothetical protein
MSRVIQIRVRGIDERGQAAMQTRFTELAAAREWRDGQPWLADSRSRNLLAQLFFDNAQQVSRAADRDELCGAGFVRVAGDEADALALLFIALEVSEHTGAEVEVCDPDNPIAKLRYVVMCGGRLIDGLPLDTILVRRAIYRRMPDGTRMEMIPPRARGSAFGRAIGDDVELSWSFIVHDIRIVDASFLGAEAEAMRIFRGLRALPRDDR